MRRTGSLAFTCLVGGLAALALGPAAEATHDSACNNLPTSAQRPGQVPCNPRQDCINNIPGSVQGPARTAAVNTCNKLATSAQCPGTVTFSPRQECVAKAGPAYPVGISSVEGGAAGGNKVYAGQADQLIVRGRNVGIRGNSALIAAVGTDADYTATITPAPGCSGDDCVGVTVTTRPGAPTGPRRFLLKPSHEHRPWAQGEFEVVAAPQASGPPVAMPKLELAKPGKPDLIVASVTSSGGNTSIIVKNDGEGPTMHRFWVRLERYLCRFDRTPNQPGGPQGVWHLAATDGAWIELLRQGQARTVDINMAVNMNAGAQSIEAWQVYVDPERHVDESNRDNNRRWIGPSKAPSC